MKFLIKAKRKNGRWRAGQFWGPEAVEVDAEDLSKEQLSQLENDPVIDIQAAPGQKAGKMSGGSDSKIGPGKDQTLTPLEKFVAAVVTLDTDNETHFTKGGKPEVGALKNAGFDCTAKERDGFWELYMETTSQK